MLQVLNIQQVKLEAPPGFEPGVEVLQTSALPLGDGAQENAEDRNALAVRAPNPPASAPVGVQCPDAHSAPAAASPHVAKAAWRDAEVPRHLKNGAGNGIRTRDFDLGKVALYH
jgi:hypothetical protein